VATLINDAYPNVHAEAVQPDMIVLSDPGDRDDAARTTALKDAQMAITRLDQPHPQVGVDAWSLQMATTNERDLGMVIPRLEDRVGDFNAAIQRSIGEGGSISHSRSPTLPVSIA
jgi:hypothetical protein